MKMIKDNKCNIQNIIDCALKEDIGAGDITTRSMIPADVKVKANIIVKEAGIVCGLDIADWVFKSVDQRIKLNKTVKDGSHVKAGKVIAVISGPARGVLSAERTALNFLQKLSGISTLTNRYVKAAGKKVKVLDTRKTTPGLRMLEKYAVRTGGGVNHRIGLYDAVLIKDNHIAIVGNLGKAVHIARKRFSKVEVEAKTFRQVKEAVDSGATRIMLDNMDTGSLKKAVKLIRRSTKKIEIEVSGGINMKNIGSVARTGVDFISVGALTHSAPALDINLKVI